MTNKKEMQKEVAKKSADKKVTPKGEKVVAPKSSGGGCKSKCGCSGKN